MTTTGPTPEQWTAISKLVNSFFSKADAAPFREPVDWQGLGLFDYPQLIKVPMDLGTIKKKIADRKYSSLFQVADDVRLVWKNCMQYNADGSDFYVLAQNLKKDWDRRFAKLVQDHAVSPPPATAGAGTSAATGAAAASAGADAAAGGNADAKVTLEEKRTFARSLYLLSKDDLGRLLVDVDNKCQVALTRNSAEDEYELNVDKIPTHLFPEFVAFVKSCKTTNSSGGGDNNKKSGGSGGTKKKASSSSTSSSNKRQKS